MLMDKAISAVISMSATLVELLQRRIGACAELILLLTWITYANIFYLCKVFYIFS